MSSVHIIIFALLSAIALGSGALAQTSSHADCVEQRKIAISSVSFNIDKKRLDEGNFLIPIHAGQNEKLEFTAPANILKNVAACFDGDAHISLRISVSSKVRFEEGPYFPSYHPKDSDKMEHSSADFLLTDLKGSDEDGLSFSVWSMGIQEIRANIVDARKRDAATHDDSSLVARLDVLPGELRRIEDVFWNNSVPLALAHLQEDLVLETYDEFFRLRNNDNDLLLAGYGENAHASPTGRFGVSVSDQGLRLYDFGALEKVFEIDLGGFVGARDHRVNAVAWSDSDSYLLVSLSAEGAVLLLPTLVNIKDMESWQLGSFSWAGTRREEPGTASEVKFDYDKLVFQSFYAERSLMAQPMEIVLLCDYLQDECPTGLSLGDWSINNWSDPSSRVSFFRTFDNTDEVVTTNNERNVSLNSSHNFYRHRVAAASYLRRDAVLDVPDPIVWIDEITPRLKTLLTPLAFTAPSVRDLPRIYTTNQYEAARLLRELESIEAQRDQPVDDMDLSVFGLPFFLEKAWLDELVDFAISEPERYAEGYPIDDRGGESQAEATEDLIFYPNEIQDEYKFYGHHGVGITLRRQGFQDSAFDKLLYYEPWSDLPNLLTEVEEELVATLDPAISECNGANGQLERILPWAVRDIWYHEDSVGNRYWIFQSSCTGGIRGRWHHGQLLLLKVDTSGEWTRLNLSDSTRCDWGEKCDRLGVERASIRVQLMNESHLVLKGVTNTMSIVEMDRFKEIATVKIDDFPSSSLVLPDGELDLILVLAPDGRLKIKNIKSRETIAEGRFVDDELILARPTGHYFATAEGASFIGFGFDGDPKVYNVSQLPDDFFVEHNLLDGGPWQNAQGFDLVAPPVIDVTAIADGQAQILLGRHASESVVHYFADGSLRESREISPAGEPRLESLQLTSSANTHEFIRISISGTQSKQHKIETGTVSSKTLYFFVAGYSNYKDPSIRSLSYPQSDALAWCTFLTSQAQSLGYDSVVDLSGGCRHLNGQDLADLIAGLPEMVKVEDTVIGFLSGHGIRNDVGDFFLLPDTAQLSQLGSTAIAWQDVAASMNAMPARTVLFLDACHSGFASGLTTNDELVASILTPNVTVISASKGRQLSWELDQLGGGVFSKALLSTFENLEKYDLSGDGTLDPEEIYRSVRDRVSRFTQTKQTPWISRNLPVNGGPLIFKSR